MVASVSIFEWTGTVAARTNTNLTSARYSLADSPTPGIGNPLVIPTTGVNYSFWKHHCLNLWPTFTQIDNIRWYTDGAIGWNVGTASGFLYVGVRASGDIGCPVSGYVNASGSTTTGVWLLSGHSYYHQVTAEISGGLINAATYVVGSPATVDSTAYQTSCFTKALVTQIAVATTATQGTQTAEEVTFRYDEI